MLFICLTWCVTCLLGVSCFDCFYCEFVKFACFVLVMRGLLVCLKLRVGLLGLLVWVGLV